jgi:hypothetical protein
MGIYGLRADIAALEKICPKWYMRKFHRDKNAKRIDVLTRAQGRYLGWFPCGRDSF